MVCRTTSLTIRKATQTKRPPTEAALSHLGIWPIRRSLFDAHRLIPCRPQALYSDGVSPAPKRTSNTGAMRAPTGATEAVVVQYAGNGCPRPFAAP
jgi:hypothetical protein